MEIKTKLVKQFSMMTLPTIGDVEYSVKRKFDKFKVDNPSANTFTLDLQYKKRQYHCLIYIVKQISLDEYNFDLSIEVVDTKWKVSFHNSGTISSCISLFRELADELD